MSQPFLIGEQLHPSDPLGTTTPYVFTCSQRVVPSFRKLIAQTVTTEDTPTHRSSTQNKEMDGDKDLHLHSQAGSLQPQDSFCMSSKQRAHTPSLKKSQKCPCPPFGTGDISEPQEHDWNSSPGWHISHPMGQLLYSWPLKTNRAKPWQTQNTARPCGLCCHLIVYTSVLYKQYFTGLGPKYENAGCKTTTDREDLFPVRFRKNKTSPLLGLLKSVN